MKNFYQILDQYIQLNTKVLEIGFGSGRDLLYYLHKNINIIGMDASTAFVQSFKLSYPKYANKIFLSSFPDINPIIKDKKFDIIYSVATWMHIKKELYKQAILTIKQVLKKQGIFIVTYSSEKRINDPRFFENITPNTLVNLFENENFKLLNSHIQPDTLNREIKWITQIFQLP